MIDTPDDLTVICHYNTITPDFASTFFTFGILPKHALEGKDLNTEHTMRSRSAPDPSW